MSQQRGERLAELLERALQMTLQHRRAWLEALRDEEAELAGELESLLAAYEEAPDGLDVLAAHILPPALDDLSRVLDAEAPLRERTIGRFRILKRLGGGGMGEVYRARDPELDRPVALKLLPGHLTADPEARARLRTEARAASALDHPNIAVVHEIGATEPEPGSSEPERLFIVMAYYAGETLKQKIAHGPLPLAHALDYAIQVAEGLVAAHEAGIVHRDIKPANLIVTQGDQVKIVDFGLAKGMGAEPTRDGTTPGTVAYMSPEQTRGEPLDACTDLWSLGVVFYEMLTGERPFRGDDDAALVHAIRHDEPKRLPSLRSEIPRALARIVESCLEKDPWLRPTRSAELLASLQAVKKGGDQATDARRRRRRRRAVGAAAALTAVSLVTALLTRGEEPGAAARADHEMAAPAAIPRLAVLPLVNLRADTATDFLRYALADEIIGRIGTVEGLIVLPSSVVRRYDDPPIDPREVAGALRVDYLLTGSYMRDRDSLRVNIELVNAASGLAEWREPIKVAYESVFRVQDLITERVVHRLELARATEPRERAVPSAEPDPTAYLLYLRAIGYAAQTEEGNRDAYEMLSRSVALDSTYAPALVAWGLTAFRLGIFGFTENRAESLEEAERAYERALSLEPNDVHALSVQALLFLETGRIEEAVVPLGRALSIQPHAADAYISLAHVYRKAGLLEEAVRAFERGRELAPTSLRLTTGGLVYLYTGAYDKALALFAHDANSPPSLAWQGIALLLQGRLAAARDRFDEAAARSPASPIGLGAQAFLAYLDGDVRRGLETLRSLEEQVEPGGAVAEELYHIARLHCVFAQLGACARMLERAVDEGFFAHPFFVVDPFLASVRDEPAVQRVLAKARARHEAFRTLVTAEGLPL